MMSCKRAIGMTLLALLSVGIVFPAADAQDNRRRRPAVIQLEEIRIEGKVEKPNAFYILNRSNLGYEVLDLRTSFIEEIVDSVQEEPF